MSFRPDLLIPWGYGSTYKRLGDVETILAAHYHPEYMRRLLGWLDSRGGVVGIGGHWRATGTQPDKSGFAPEGKSFHQDQRFVDGFVGACAVDLVAKDGVDSDASHDGVTWAMVPRQGSVQAAVWGVHCNIDSEAWHMQPVEIDGWASWVAAGRPAPRANYPIPEPAPPAPTKRPRGCLDMVAIMKYGGTPTANYQGWYSPDGGTFRYPVRSMDHAALLVGLGAVDAKTRLRVTAGDWANVSHTTDSVELSARLGAVG
jgi:hypothetical protein